jgi:hypothetical protein
MRELEVDIFPALEGGDNLQGVEDEISNRNGNNQASKGVVPCRGGSPGDPPPSGQGRRIGVPSDAGVAAPSCVP